MASVFGGDTKKAESEDLKKILDEIKEAFRNI
jgi:hypothetical protein